MRVLLLLFASFVWCFYNPPLARAESDVASDEAGLPSRVKSCRESIPPQSTEEYNKKCIALAGKLAAMRKDALVIRLDDGRRMTFKNDPAGSISVGAFGYGLADFHPDTRIFVVCDISDDAQTCVSVDGRTGRKRDFKYQIPIFSPDGNWVFTIDYDEDGSTPQNLKIFDARGEKSPLVWDAKPRKARLPFTSKSVVVWDNDRTIRIEAKPQIAFVIRADDGSWSVSKAPAN